MKEKLHSWGVTCRPKTLILSTIPVWVGTTLAPVVRWDYFFATWAMAICIQIGTNLYNDACDYRKGIDTKERVGPKRGILTGHLSLEEVHLASLVFFALALTFGIFLAALTKWVVGVIAALSIFSGMAYSAGPKPLSATGAAEAFVVVFFGVVATATTTFIQSPHWSVPACWAGLQLGLIAASVLAIDNLRDINEDRRANKQTLAVRFGERFGRIEITVLMLAPYLLSFFWLGWSALAPVLTLPLAVHVLRAIWKTPPSPAYDAFLGKAALLYGLFGVTLLAIL
ncbi:MAG: 1,4-dihydroxy-2-naphthoate octaprenyltransferase [Chlamydiia bacterium]|nr:1,4-dihydroxy-2-naphthoate octaprenyltransferase [Chlamydiia bacterium]